jgi:hypothetical protein
VLHFVLESAKCEKSFSEKINSLNKDQKTCLEDCLGEHPFLTLYFGEIAPALNAVSIEDKSGREKLIEITGFTNSEALAEKLIILIESLPRTYRVSVCVPNCLTQILARENMEPILGDHVSLIGTWNSKEVLSKRSKKLNDIVATDFNNKPQEDSAFIYFNIDGLYFEEFDIVFANKIKPLLKSFFGHLLGFDILSKTLRNDVKEREDGFYINEINTELPNPLKGGVFDAELFGFIDNLEVPKNGDLNILKKLKIIIDVLNAEMSSDRRRLMQASRWLFDSRSNSDTVMGFMQLAICAEVLLGTSTENEGLTKTLADRCAYLIASSSKERDELISEFREIYKLRSKIVHNGEASFKKKEHQHLSRLRIICNRILQRESELLAADSPENKHRQMLSAALRGQAAEPLK